MTKHNVRGRELIVQTYSHENTHVPWVPFAGIHAGRLKGYTASEILQDKAKFLECLLEVKKTYYPDGMPVIFDLQVEAEILGCNLRWSDKAPPMVIDHPCSEEMIVLEKIPERHEGRLPIIIEVMKSLKKEIGTQVALFGLVCGPLTLASHLRGTNFYIDLITNPQYAVEMLSYTSQVTKVMSEYYFEAGMDIIAVVDPVVSQISPTMFNEFLSKKFSDIFSHIKSQDVYSSFFVCGDATKNLDSMCKTNPDSIFVDENIDMVHAYDILSKHKIILGGNIPLATTMLFGTQQDNMKYVVDLFEKIGTENLIIAPGCDMPYDTPVENVVGVIEAVQKPDLIRKSLENYHKEESNIVVELPNYHTLHKPLVEVFTIDSEVCAACGYMLETAVDVKKMFGEKIDLVEYKWVKQENIERAKRLNIQHLPCILINGEVKYSSIIPTKDKLFTEIEKYL
ncbi:MAG: uroporphyrinogen decarboxylase family protein [Candidatus Hodarchaeales archaeon]|jgi:uroporphyrinogen decarboxylase